MVNHNKDNMIMRQWQGDPGCYFCGAPEDRDHRGGGGVVALCFSQATRPGSYMQYWAWVKSALPRGHEVYVLGLAAICWATCKVRNHTNFDKKPIKSSMDVLFFVCVFLQYWAGLYTEGMWPLIKAGVETLLSTVTKVAKDGEHVARRCIGPVCVILGEQNRRVDANAQDV
jgi:hypothetical protein